MKNHSHEIPKAFRVIQKSLQKGLSQSGIEQKSFLEYCLAAFLFAWDKFNRKSLNKNGPNDPDLLDALCKKNGYSVNETFGGFDILTGLSTIDKNDANRIEVIERFINYFSAYLTLKKENYKNLKGGGEMYDEVCEELKKLRNEVRVPLRLEPKARVTNIGSNKNGFVIEIEIDDEHDGFFDDDVNGIAAAEKLNSKDEVPLVADEHASAEKMAMPSASL